MYQYVIEEMALSVSLALMKENLKSKRISGSNENEAMANRAISQLASAA
jgi:hypothetical protein